MVERARIAVVEDDPIMGGSLVQRLKLEDYAVDWFDTAESAVERLPALNPDVVLCDIKLPEMSGEDLFRQLAGIENRPPFLFITGFAQVDQAVRLMRAGAVDYLTKPFDIAALLRRIEDLVDRSRHHEPENHELGVSPAMQEVADLLTRVADVESTVLITGESGAGKEVAARYLHRISPQAEKPFLAVNCAAIPAELIDSELFGHERGAFTSALSRHRGYVERAGEGILFLDEIAELPAGVQAKLLRLIQERNFYRVGGEEPLPFRARLVCATNADLEKLVEEGRFRADLYYRIHVIDVRVPPLRQRPQDVMPLVEHFLDVYRTAFGRKVTGFTAEAVAAMKAHDWPGNVRELRNRIERAVALATGTEVGIADLFARNERPKVENLHAICAAADIQEDAIATLAEARDTAERRHIHRALAATGGQIGEAARLLGVSRTTLWEKMRRLSVPTEQHTGSPAGEPCR